MVPKDFIKNAPDIDFGRDDFSPSLIIELKGFSGIPDYAINIGGKYSNKPVMMFSSASRIRIGNGASTRDLLLIQKDLRFRRVNIK